MRRTRHSSLWLRLGALLLVIAAAIAPTATAAQGTGDRAQILKIAIPGQIPDPTNFNLYSASVDRSNGLHQLVYEYFFYNNLQTGEFIPWLADSMQYNDDYTALTVRLKQGITWNDGQPFTPDDVVFTYDLLRNNPSMVWADEATKAVKSVDKVDELTVRFNLTQSNPRFHLTREAFPAVGIWGGITILPKHIWEHQDPLTFKNYPPVGTGPYKLKDASQTAFTYERRDDWWGTKAWGVQPAPKEVDFQYVGPETNVALALTNNDLDTPNIGILSAGSFQQVASRNPNVSAWSKNAPYAWQDPCPRALMVQNAHPPLDNPQVRWALSYLLDRQSIVNLAYEGVTVPTWGIWPFYDANKPYFDATTDLQQQYPTTTFDPDMANQLFSQAGVSPGDLHLKYVVDADSTEEMKASTVIADQLTSAGIQVDVEPLSKGVLNDTILRGDYDIKLHSFCPGYIVENLDLFTSKYYVPLGQPAPFFERNSFRYRNPALDAVVDQMYKVAPNDQATMIKLFHDGLAIWMQDLPVIPVVQAPALVPFNSTYWQGWPNADIPWNMPVSWWATFNLVVTGYRDQNGNWIGGIKPTGH
ncbi:MAG: ABC transporter substrate-binding protein [Chloroflexi bacterium]|nr:ABC transporter substrate-binding protein [Chloroflexota bacterium]